MEAWSWPRQDQSFECMKISHITIAEDQADIYPDASVCKTTNQYMDEGSNPDPTFNWYKLYNSENFKDLSRNISIYIYNT